jgi:hypothetical protein
MNVLKLVFLDSIYLFPFEHVLNHTYVYIFQAYLKPFVQNIILKKHLFLI